jgi:hypothetical protein
MKQLLNQIGQPIKATRKSGTRQKPADESEFVKGKPTFLEITAKMEHCCNGNSNNFRVRYFEANILGASARLEKNVNKAVYCNSAMAHLIVLFRLNLFGDKILKEDFSYFKYQMPITGNLGYLKLKLALFC